MLRLHYHPNSTFSRRVRIAAIEKGLELELVALDFAGAAHLRSPYKELNPYGRIPTLEDGDFAIIESTAILDYLEAKFPTPPLVPTDPRGRARVAMHAKLCDLEIGVHTRTLIFPSRFVPRDQWDEAAMTPARAQVARHLAILDGQLVGPWALGEMYTLADVCYTPFIQFLDVIGVPAPPRVAAWRERLLDRPSARATAPTR